MRSFLRSAALWLGISIVTLMCFIGAFTTSIFTLPFDRRRLFAGRWPGIWSKLVVRVNPAWSGQVDARRLPAHGHYVVTCNHQSLGDIIITLHLPHIFKFIAKQSVFRVPFLGWYMYVAGFIPVARGQKHSIARCMETARKWLDRGASVLFYPEGTRSADGEIRAFKHGAFKLAVQAQVPILPVLIDGAADLLPKHSFYFSTKKTPMRLVVGDPIPVAGLTLDDVPALAERTRQAIIEMQRELRGEQADPIRKAS